MGPSGAEAGEGLRNALRPALRRAPLTPAARRRLSPAAEQTSAFGLCQAKQAETEFTNPLRQRDARLRGAPSVTADVVILSLPFAVQRKIDTSGARFDARKNTAKPAVHPPTKVIVAVPLPAVVEVRGTSDVVSISLSAAAEGSVKAELERSGAQLQAMAALKVSGAKAGREQ